MLRQRQDNRVLTTFRGYFTHQAMNRLVKKMFVVIPDMPTLANRVNKNFEKIVAPLLIRLFNKNNALRGRISMINLSALNEILAIQLRQSTKRMLKLNPEKVTFEKMDLQEILGKQSQILRQLVDKQKDSLREQSQTILKAQLERRQNRQPKARNKNKK